MPPRSREKRFIYSYQPVEKGGNKKSFGQILSYVESRMSIFSTKQAPSNLVMCGTKYPEASEKIHVITKKYCLIVGHDDLGCPTSYIFCFSSVHISRTTMN